MSRARFGDPSGLALALAVLVGACSAESEADAPKPSTAAEFRSARVETRVEDAARIARTRGFAAVGEPWRGFLVEQATDVRSAPMQAGSCHVVIAVASESLRELELRVFDADGAEVARDAEQGNLAAIRFCPVQTGTYYLALRAVAGSGLYELRQLRGPTGLSFRVDDVLSAREPEPRAP